MTAFCRSGWKSAGPLSTLPRFHFWPAFGDGSFADSFCHLNHMPNTASAKKYLRQSQARRLRNRQQRSALRTKIKQFRALLATSPSREDADKSMSGVAKAIDQAAASNLIHANTAARTKSRLSALKKKSCG